MEKPWNMTRKDMVGPDDHDYQPGDLVKLLPRELKPEHDQFCAHMWVVKEDKGSDYSDCVMIHRYGAPTDLLYPHRTRIMPITVLDRLAAI